MIVIYLLMALVGSAATLFAAQNIDPVVIRFLVWRIEGMPLALVILLSLLVGVVFASLSGAVRHWRLRSRVRQLEAQILAVFVFAAVFADVLTAFDAVSTDARLSLAAGPRPAGLVRRHGRGHPARRGR